MKKKITIYAPCDGVVKELKDISDQVFADGLLGTGLYITPSNNDFYAPVSGKITLIAETNHALYFEVAPKVNILMHIGLNTVNINPNPFTTFCQQNDEVQPQTKVISINLATVKNKNTIILDTPIVLDQEISNSYDLVILKYGVVKQGDIIGEFNLKLEKEIPSQLVNPLKHKGKYESIAEEIMEYIGGKQNFKNFYNCMTRFRINILDQTRVDLSAIQKISIVKGTHWSGTELQIIIGGEVYKVRESFANTILKLNNVNVVKTNRTFKQKLLGLVSGVLLPNLPMLMGGGLMMALYAVLVQTKAIEQINAGSNLANYSVSSVLSFIISQTLFNVIGIFFAYNATRYFGGDPIIGLAIGIILASPNFITISGSGTGQWKYEYFKILGTSVGLQSYANLVIPTVFAGYLYSILDRWIKTWMPTAVDIVFRPFLAILFTTSIVFVAVGPFLNIFETFIMLGVKYAGTIPYGIGTAIFAFFWQPLVLTGMHIAVVLPLILELIKGNDQLIILPGIVCGVFGQVGAVIGIALRTKNAKLRQAAYASITSGIFGITEPSIYGITLPKGKPFFLGCCGAAITGFLAGLVELAPTAQLSHGILGFLSMLPKGPWAVGQWFIFCFILALAIPALLNFVFYTEYPSEKSLTQRANHSVAKIYSLYKNQSTRQSLKELESVFFPINNLLTKEVNITFKKYETNLIKIQKLEVMIQNLQTKEDKKKDKLIKLADHYVAKNNSENLNKTVLAFTQCETGKKRAPLLEKLVILNKENMSLTSDVTNIRIKFLDQATLILQELGNKIKYPELISFQSLYFNAINTLDINYQLIEKMPLKFSVHQIKKLINKKNI